MTIELATRFVFHTTDVETWGDWKGHRVAINGQEIGRLKDPSDTYGPAEVFTIKVPTATLEKILSGKDNFNCRSNWRGSLRSQACRTSSF